MGGSVASAGECFTAKWQVTGAKRQAPRTTSQRPILILDTWNLVLGVTEPGTSNAEPPSLKLQREKTPKVWQQMTNNQ
jgi:hypothetical protein